MLRPCRIIFVPRLNKSKSDKLSCQKILWQDNLSLLLNALVGVL